MDEMSARERLHVLRRGAQNVVAHPAEQVHLVAQLPHHAAVTVGQRRVASDVIQYL